jgi:hypothetical protein
MCNARRNGEKNITNRMNQIKEYNNGTKKQRDGKAKDWWYLMILG